MSSDRKDPGATWKNTPNANLTQPPDANPPLQAEDDPSFEQHEQQQMYAYEPDASGSYNVSDDPFLEEQDDEGQDIASESSPVAARSVLFNQVRQYVTLIVLPLLFFGLACLLILPPIAIGHAYFPSVSFWFVAIVLVLIAVGQGVAIYFAGPYQNMWVLGTFGGLILFILFGAFVVVGPLAGTLLLLAILVGCIYLARRCIHSVLEGSVDIVYVYGKYRRTLYTGFNLIWPWEEVRQQVNIEETNWNCPPQKIQLSPEEDVILRAVISYQVVPEDAYLAITQVNNWEESLRNLFVTTLQTISTHFAPTDFLAWPQSLQAYQGQIAASHQDAQSTHLPDEGVDDFTGGPARREHINTLLFQQMRDRVALWGIQIHWVRIRDIELAPHTLAAISARPSMPDYDATAHNDQGEKELVAASSMAQPDTLQSADRQGNVKQERAIEHVPTDQEPTEVMQLAAFPTPSLPLPPQNLPSEDILIKGYRAVQSGSVTDPQAIRQMATIFEAVARDPEASQKVSFDAERAADNLYEQARRYEEQYHSSMVYSDATRVDLHRQ
jgi:regulator of protease activity HflC (stomatin/prohibitin superfamily)